jgi:hypothetical protein
MIGAAKSQAVDASINSSYEVLLSPGSLNIFSSNGSETSQIVRSTVNSGTGPFTYLWTISAGNISITSPTDPDTTFASSGFNVSYTEGARLTVTDTGNGNAETFKLISVKFTFQQGGGA